MLKKDLIEEVAAASGHTQKDVRAVLEAVEVITLRAIAAGKSVMLLGLGKLVTSARGPRKARHMVTGESVVVGPRRVPLLRASESLVAAANGKAV